MPTETTHPAQNVGDPQAKQFYAHVLERLTGASIPFLVGGAFALYRYTGISRFTKDFDLFILKADRDRILEMMAREGYDTERSFDHWLAKIRYRDLFVDLIYNSGNGVAEVDGGWFEHAVSDTVLGWQVKLVPPEEMIWSKAFVMERERYDGADVAHLVRGLGEKLDWRRLVVRFGPNWRVLLAHLVLFGFTYPGERARIPGSVMDELVARLETEVWTPPTGERVCRGTMLSREQYLIDVGEWGYGDARLVSQGGTMTPEETERWTAAIHEED